MGNVYSITLCDRDLHHVPDDIYKHHKHVAKLLLRRNNIQEIPPEIKVLTNLIELSLRDNLLTGVPFEMTSLKLLQKLSLANNRLQEPPEPIAAFTQLTWLSLASNTLTSLPDAFSNLQKLTSLDLQRNRFSAIPECIFYMRSLSILLLQKNRIATISPKIGQCTQLVSLNLSYNRIQHLPVEMRDCRSLQHLLLSVNTILALPSILCEAWTGLLNLDMHTNDLKLLPDNLGSMKSLRRLNLAINKIEEIPESVGKLQLLEWLNLNDNKLVSLPSSMDQMQKLVKMGIVQNRLRTLPAALARLSVLYKLDCRRNEIEYLPSAFKEMQGIHSLLLEENPLSVKYGISTYTQQPPSLLELASRAVLKRYCPQENGFLGANGLSSLSPSSPSSLSNSGADNSGMGIAHLLPLMADLGLTRGSTLPAPTAPNLPTTPQKSRYSFFSRACSTVHPQSASKPARTSTLSSTYSSDSSSSPSSSSSSSTSPSTNSPSSTSISSSLINNDVSAGDAESGSRGKKQRSSPRTLRPPALFRRSSKSQHSKSRSVDLQGTPTTNHQSRPRQRHSSANTNNTIGSSNGNNGSTTIIVPVTAPLRKRACLSRIERLLDPESSSLPFTLIEHLSLPTTACDYCSRRMCTSGWVDFLEPAKLGSSRMIIPVRHRMCSLQCVRQQHRDSFGGELMDLFESTDFHIGPNGEMVGSRPIIPGELDEYMIEAVQEAAEAAGISITHLLEQHQQQQAAQQQQATQQEHLQPADPQDGDEEVRQATAQSTMPGALPVTQDTISITALNQAHVANNPPFQPLMPSGPTSVIRQTTARLRRSLSRPSVPIEIQVDANGQLRRVVYRQNRSNGGAAPRRRFLETFRSFGSQVASQGVGSATMGLGGNGNGGGLGGLGVLAVAGLGQQNNNGAAAGGAGNVADPAAAAGGRGGSTRAAGEVMNVTTFAVELERF